MIKRQNGFSIVELLIVIAIMGFVLAATSEMFIGMLRNYKQQSKITETNIEGSIGLDLLRRDVESAGYGLPWAMSGITYNEATGYAANYNDQPSNPPRAILAGDNMLAGSGFVTGTDYLVIKSVDVAGNDTSMKWGYLPSSGVPNPSSDTATDSLQNNVDKVIVLSPGTSATGGRTLIASTTYNAASMAFGSPNTTMLIYGINPGPGPIRMPFNRADYYVKIPAAGMPQRCAQGTGILYKAVVDQASGNLMEMPLLDCVADMQVVTLLDTDSATSPGIDTYVNGLPPAAYSLATTIRDQVKEVHIFILAHEGERDTSYTNPSATIRVGEVDGGVLYGRDFNFNVAAIQNWQNYRWKVYTLVIDLYNLI